jgi:hypothetical protein
MSRKYKHLTGIDLVKGFCSEVLNYGIKRGLNIDGVKIWLHPRLVKSLELDQILIVKHDDCDYKIPVVADYSIEEIPLGDGKFQSDIRVGNPEWKIDISEGEFWFNES